MDIARSYLKGSLNSGNSVNLGIDGGQAGEAVESKAGRGRKVLMAQEDEGVGSFPLSNGQVGENGLGGVGAGLNSLGSMHGGKKSRQQQEGRDRQSGSRS